MNSIYLILIGSLFLLFACNKDEFPVAKSYPIIRTLEATDINDTGVTLRAEILKAGEAEVIEYGFIWSLDENGISTEFKQSLGKECNCERFELRVSSDLKKDQLYHFKPYLKTFQHIVYGAEQAFISKGAAAPVITDFFPKSGTSGDTVVIEGNNFSILIQHNELFFGNEAIQILSASVNKIVGVIANNVMTSGPVKVKLTSGGFSIVSTADFIFEGHTITDFFPKSGILAESIITITGTGFSADSTENLVLIGGAIGTLLESSTTRLVAKLPYRLIIGEIPVKISVIVNGKEFVASQPFVVKSRWRQLKPFPGSARRGSFFTFVNGKGYLIGGGDSHSGCFEGNCFGEIWEYDPQVDRWNFKGNFPGGERSQMVGFAMGNKIYTGLGRKGFTLYTDWWELDVVTNQWTRKRDFPAPGRYASIDFATNEKGYLLGGYAYPGGVPFELFEYNPVDDSWINKGNNFNPIYRFGELLTYFNYKNKIYFAEFYVDNNYNTSETPNLMEFNTNNFALTPVAGFPKELNLSIFFNFILEDTLYIGLSDRDNYGSVLCWTYNFVSKTWQRIEDFPGGSRFYAISFAHQGKGFFGLGEQGYLETDMWVYDSTLQ